MESLKTIQMRRKKLNLTQNQLAKFAEVSQSLIAKIESESIDPSYTNAMKIFDALRRLEKDSEKSAKDIMNSKIIFVGSDATIKDAISRMKKHEISQIPVLKGEQIVGFVSENSIVEAMLSGKDRIILKDIMQPAPPTIPQHTSHRTVVSLLNCFPLVIVTQRGKMRGIITKSDLLRNLYS